jgi:hypothetical protein
MTPYEKELAWLITLCKTNQAWKEYAWWKAQKWDGMREDLIKAMKRGEKNE